MAQLGSADRAQLREFLGQRFNLNEMKTLCFDLGVDFEQFPHATKIEFSRELIAYFERQNKMGCLIAAMVQERPDERLTQLLAQVPGCLPNQKVQIVLSNDKIKSGPDLRQKVAELLGISVDEVMILATAPGSVKVLVGLPPREVGKLVALPLPYQLHAYEIVAVTPFATLPTAVQQSWRTAVTRTTLATTTTTATGGLSLVVKIIIALLIVAGIMAVGILIARSRQPELRVYNLCPNPLPIPAPDIIKTALSLPEAIPSGGSIQMPMVTGTGTYELLMTRSGVMVLVLPRAIPGIGLREVELGVMGQDTAVTINGRPLEPPQQFPIAAGQSYEMVICAPR